MSGFSIQCWIYWSTLCIYPYDFPHKYLGPKLKILAYVYLGNVATNVDGARLRCCVLLHWIGTKNIKIVLDEDAFNVSANYIRDICISTIPCIISLKI